MALIIPILLQRNSYLLPLLLYTLFYRLAATTKLYCRFKKLKSFTILLFGLPTNVCQGVTGRLIR